MITTTPAVKPKTQGWLDQVLGRLDGLLELKSFLFLLLLFLSLQMFKVSDFLRRHQILQDGVIRLNGGCSHGAHRLFSDNFLMHLISGVKVDDLLDLEAAAHFDNLLG
jgi:hypothetical protein